MPPPKIIGSDEVGYNNFDRLQGTKPVSHEVAGFGEVRTRADACIEHAGTEKGKARCPRTIHNLSPTRAISSVG